MRPEILLDEDHAGRAGLRGDAERSNRCRAIGVRRDRRQHGAEDELKVQGDGRTSVSRCGAGVVGLNRAEVI